MIDAMLGIGICFTIINDKGMFWHSGGNRPCRSAPRSQRHAGKIERAFISVTA